MMDNAHFSVFADRAWLTTGWQRNVVLTIKDGQFVAVKANAAPPAGVLRIQGPVLPTLANVHSHAFQRVMAGMAEVSLNPKDSFWSWRECMYQLVAKLTPEQVRVIATQLYIDMLKAGYTQVGEFHYLHHDCHGQPYADPAEMSLQLLTAAEQSGIGMTLLPVLYAYAGFGAQPPVRGQARFIHSTDSYLKLQHQLGPLLVHHPQNQLGMAFHSLRAVSPSQMDEVLAELNDGRRIHIHIAEQQQEVEDCLSWCGCRPVEWLDDNVGLNSRWTLIHATHLNAGEVQRIAGSGAVVGLCPTTEANLGDGMFPGVEFEQASGRWGIGSDSHVSLSLVEELRMLEYGQRLRDQQRNRLYRPFEHRIGDNLFTQALSGGNQACGVHFGLTVGARADFMVLNHWDPFIAASRDQDRLNRWLFACRDNVIKDVYVAGKPVIKEGHHDQEERINQRFIKVIQQVMSQ